jgi:hypothetical protein
MERIKNFFVGVAKFAYDFFIHPIVNLRNLTKMDNTTKAISIIEAATRVVIMASWVVAVPALLVTLAWTWVIGTFVYVAAHVAFALGSAIAVAKMVGAFDAAVPATKAEEKPAAEEAAESTIILATA